MWELVFCEGIFCGVLFGGVVVGVLMLLREVENVVIVVIVCDCGDCYFLIGVFD